jgi:hypothetical protein
VLAFDVMERELKRFGAPRGLQWRTQRARADEERHYNRMTAKARRDGTTVDFAANRQRPDERQPRN